jgi:protein-S-isoprenylcysteine O-methyltransferase Ste14
LAREIMGVVLTAVLLFWPAGRLDWPMGWVMVGLMTAWVAGTAFVLITRSPELIADRLGPKKGSKTWDTIILSFFGVTMVSRFVVAGFDMRYGWSSGISLPVQLVMFGIAAAGYALLVWATASNAFFAQTVRIQQERGQTVATGGPYGFVRHPGYVGTILTELATPLMLGSCWALIPGALGAGLMVLRTALEDRTLRGELEGYEEYSRSVRYRLAPGVW